MNAVRNERNELIDPSGSMLLAKVRIMEIDHDPDGYPAITMREVSALANYLAVEMWRADAAEQEVYRLQQILSNVEAEPTGSEKVRVGNHYCIDGIKYMVTLVHLGEAVLTSRCGKFRIEKCSWILSYSAQVCDPTKEDS